MTIITPTIGRRVWYWPSEAEYQASASNRTMVEPAMLLNDRDQPCDAGICYVHTDGTINLTVADHTGAMHARRSVPLLQDDAARDPNGLIGCAAWMPYQKTQASKA
jgi:hypothetical protein